MDTSDIPWCWYYLADCGRWHKFEDDPNNPLQSEDIEKYYLRNSKGVLNTSSSDCHQLIPLNDLTPEYNTVAGYVREDGLLDRSIVSISRIQNLDLWEYFAKHATYADKYSKSSTDPLPLYVGGTGSVPRDTKIVFLARVMIGKSIVGQSDFRKPDDGSPENSHDSCVDVKKHPNIFVIFDSNQIYPEYLIQYR
uniref:Poly(ADP-ribose) polymerase family member 11 n=1 Tax=Seriola lalandi dorsalis TaxID=1841481 RepID=A0A3B4YIM8_SERLL